MELMRAFLGKDSNWPASTWSNTLARSTGAVISVVGTAERNPAVASSAVDSDSEVRLGVKAKISRFDASYA